MEGTRYTHTHGTQPKYKPPLPFGSLAFIFLFEPFARDFFSIIFHPRSTFELLGAQLASQRAEKRGTYNYVLDSRD